MNTVAKEIMLHKQYLNIKIKILKTALQEEDTKNIAASIAKQTESELIDVRGHTFLLFKKKKKR